MFLFLIIVLRLRQHHHHTLLDTEMAQTAAISNRVRYKPQYLMEKPTPLQRDSLGIELAQILFEVAIRLETSNMSYHSLQNVGAKLRITEQRTK